MTRSRGRYSVMKLSEITVGYYLGLKSKERMLFNGLQAILKTKCAKQVLPAAEKLKEIRTEIYRIEEMLIKNKRTAA